jgi:catechol 2,3-dioxygenase-like lactoylglutathione lyase family enzyme
MLAYTVIGAKDLDKLLAFYDSLLEPIGGKQLMGLDRIKFYGTDSGGAMLAVCRPANGDAQSCGNGQMIAIPGGSPEGVDALYQRALDLGASDAGAPEQALPFFYGGYVHDPDGNKIGFVHLTPA